MNQKTDTTNTINAEKEREFSPDFIRLLVALTGATLLLVFMYEHHVFNTPNRLWARMYLYPWIVAGGNTIANGLTEFSGKTPTLVAMPDRLAALLGLLFGLVIGPTLFFFGWYNRRKDRASGASTPSLKGSAVISVIGGILTFSIAIPSIPMAWRQVRVASYLHSAQAIQSNKDQMINDLNMIAYNARQYRILPSNFGGGNGSFAGYSIPQTLMATEHGTYAAMVTEDAITLKSISKKYSDCKISTRINKEGEFDNGEWKYEGEFQ